MSVTGYSFFVELQPKLQAKFIENLNRQAALSILVTELHFFTLQETTRLRTRVSSKKRIVCPPGLPLCGNGRWLCEMRAERAFLSYLLDVAVHLRDRVGFVLTQIQQPHREVLDLSDAGRRLSARFGDPFFNQRLHDRILGIRKRFA